MAIAADAFFVANRLVKGLTQSNAHVFDGVVAVDVQIAVRLDVQVNHAFVTLHIDNLKGENAHHQAETVFKACARALRAAVERDPRAAGMIPSTKGSL